MLIFRNQRDRHTSLALICEGERCLHLLAMTIKVSFALVREGESAEKRLFAGFDDLLYLNS